MTRYEKIDAILGAMDNWDEEVLIAYAKSMRREGLLKLDNLVLEDVYQEDVVGPTERHHTHR